MNVIVTYSTTDIYFYDIQTVQKWARALESYFLVPKSRYL